MQKESDINKDSLSAQWLLVKTGAQNTFSSLGETLRQPLMDILYTVKSVTGALRRWVEANPELTGTLMKASAVVAAVTVGLGTLAVALAAVLGPLAVIRLGFSVLGIWSVRCSAQSNRSCGYCTGRRGAGCLEILATHHRISRWRGGRIQSGGRSHQCCIRTT